MRITLLCACLLWTLAVHLAEAQSPTPAKAAAATAAPGPRTTRKWFMQPEVAQYKKGEVDAKTNKDQDAVMTVDKTKLAANTNVEGKGDFSAKRDGNPEQVKVQSAAGKQANADQSQKATGLRTADAGKYHGDLKQSKTGNDQNVNLDANTGQKMDTVMHGNKSSFDAAGSKGNKYNLTPQGQSKTNGAGTISRNSDKYNYQESKAANGDTTAQLTNVGTGPAKKTYTCQAQKQGVTNCVDQNGLKVGEAVTQSDGTVIIKKTVAKGVDVSIGKAKPTKTADGKGLVVLNDGEAQAQVGNMKERDCMADYGKKNSSITIKKPLYFKHNSQTTQDGKTMVQFPDCVVIGAQITLPPGADASRLAVQFDVNILPAGKLKCVDSGACNKDCYYCNLCNNSRKVDILANSDSGNLCAAKGGNTYDIRTTVCPPPEAFNKAVCSGMTKSDLTYYQKKGDIDVRMLFYMRTPNEAAAKQDFNYKLKTDTTGFVKKAWIISYAADNKNLLNANSPTDFDLEEWYIHKYGGKDDLVGCVQGLTNYTLTGNKIQTSFLLEAGSVIAAPKSLVDTKTCPQVDAINQQQAQQDMTDAQQKFTTKAGFNWLNAFSGGKRRRRNVEIDENA